MAAGASLRIVPLPPQIGEANRTFCGSHPRLADSRSRSPAKPSRADRDNLHQHQRPGADGTAFASPVIGVVTEIVEPPRPQRWLLLLQRTSQKGPPHTPTPIRG